MKKILYMLAVLTALMPTACTLSETLGEGTDRDETRVPVVGIPDDAVKGEILVKFDAGVAEMLDKAGLTKASSGGRQTRSGVVSFDEVLDIVGGYEIERVFPVDARNEERTRKSGLHLWYVVRFDASQDVRTVAEKLSRIGELSTIQYNSQLKRTPDKARAAAPAALYTSGKAPESGRFNDPGLGRQWHYVNKGYFDVNGNGVQDESDEVMIGADGKTTMLEGADVNVENAWGRCAGDPSVIVAVMDEGVMWSHPDLQANMWVNETEEWLSQEDNDNNGYKGDRYGYNFVHDSGIITWDDLLDTGHGTHVAGTVAAVNNNGEGVCGIAGGTGNGDGVKLMSIQIFAGDAGATLQNEVRGIKYAADNGAVILQCSWGFISALADPLLYPMLGPRSDEEFEETSPLEVEAFEYFIYNAGSPDGVIDGGVVIFASGNEFAAMPAYPAAYKDYICVSAMGADFSPSSYTNYGSQVDVTTPGGDTDYHANELGGVYSTLPPHVSDNLGYGYMDGTSMACPHMSGIAALGLSYAAQEGRHFNSREYRDLLLQAVRPIDDRFFEADKDGNPTSRPKYKTFYKGWSLMGPIIKDRLSLDMFKGKAGKGVADAGMLLDLIDRGAGHEITLSNIALPVGTSKTVSVAFLGEAPFTVSSSDESVATVSVSGSRVTVNAVAKGTCRYTVTSGDGKSLSAFVTVRNKANDSGII